MSKYLVVAAVVVGLLAAVGLQLSAAGTASALIPGVASFILPGLGQLLNDQVDKAILHFLVSVALDGLWWSGLGPSWLPGYGWYLYGPITLIWRLYSGYDAYTVAKEKGFSIGFTGTGVALAYRF